ncbi:MAG: STAS domain-containing protein [Solobacterium sp.]|nr:STAS domain-containing protein [Solobacterium sp.]
MDIQVEKQESNVTLFVSGRIDTNTSPEFEETINQNIEEDTNLVLDFEKVEYISSAALRVLLATHKKLKNGGSLRIVHVNDVVMEILNITGFLDILDVEN